MEAAIGGPVSADPARGSEAVGGDVGGRHVAAAHSETLPKELLRREDADALYVTQ